MSNNTLGKEAIFLSVKRVQGELAIQNKASSLVSYD